MVNALAQVSRTLDSVTKLTMDMVRSFISCYFTYLLSAHWCGIFVAVSAQRR